MNTIEDNCILIKNRINTIIEWHNKYIEIIKTINEEHPEFIKQPVDLTQITEQLGSIPNNIDKLKTYIKSATDIYLKLMSVYEMVKDDQPDYIKAKMFLYT